MSDYRKFLIVPAVLSALVAGGGAYIIIGELYEQTSLGLSLFIYIAGLTCLGIGAAGLAFIIKEWINS